MIWFGEKEHFFIRRVDSTDFDHDLRRDAFEQIEMSRSYQ